jgi:multiple antibiotic resistance protein
MNHSLFTISFALFLLMDPVGNIPIYISVLKDIEPKRQRIIIIRELLIALGVIILFTFIGEYLLEILNVGQETILIAGGIILFIIALKMIFPNGAGYGTEGRTFYRSPGNSVGGRPLGPCGGHDLFP